MNLKRAVRPLLALLLAPALVVYSIWLPELRHYQVATVAVDETTLARLRTTPGRQTLEELADLSLGAEDPRIATDRVELARRILVNDHSESGPGRPQFRVPFDPEDLLQDTPSRQLKIASMVVPDTLLDAYRATGDVEFFEAAGAYIFDMLAYERGRRLPVGLLWNDHAIVVRVMVMGKFWHHYRILDDYDPRRARTLIEAMLQAGNRLADDGEYTVRSNHGVMQNLGLLYLALALPDAPQSIRFRDIGLRRLEDQLRFYVTEAGVVQEHSAGYQRFGVELLGIALRFLHLLEMPIPDSLASRYQAARDVLQALTRPDGSLPQWGDTHRGGQPPVNVTTADGAQAPAPARVPPGRDSFFDPVAGLSLWWTPRSRVGAPAQLVTSWANFPSGVHKHSDELAVLFWSDHAEWWSASGYWPYGEARRPAAIGWSGANAPHDAAGGLRQARDRHSEALARADSQLLSALDLVREERGDRQFRRFVARAGNDLFVAIDANTGMTDFLRRSVWTTGRGIRAAATGGDRNYQLTDLSGARHLNVIVSDCDGGAVRIAAGEKQPFLGWVATREGLTPASSLVVDCPASQASALVWQRSGRIPDAGDAIVDVDLAWRSESDWALAILRASGAAVTLQRHADRLTASGATPEDATVALAIIDDVAAARSRLAGAYLELAGRYPPFRSLIPYRGRASLAVVVLGALLALGCWFAPVWGMRRSGLLYAGSAMIMVVAAAWLHLVYFQV